MIDEYKNQKQKGILIRRIIAIASIVLIIAGIAGGVSIYLEAIQLNEIGGFSFVYFTNLKYKIIFGVAVFILVFAAVFTTTIFIRKNLIRYIKENNLPGRRLPMYSAALAIAFIASIMTKDFFYQKALNFLNSTEFGKAAPILGGDIGYYVFQRPFLMSVYEFATGLWLFVIIYTAAYYLLVLMSLYSALSLQQLNIKSIVRHNLFNVAIFFFIRAFSYTFQREGILYGSVVNVTGAGYVDVNIWYNYFRAVPFILAIIVAASLALILKGKLKKAAYTIAIYPLIWIIVSIAAVIVQSVIVKPNEINKENEYLKYNIEQTRAAYKLDKIKTADFPIGKDLSLDVIKNNPETISNIRIIDYKPTLENNIQLQSNTNFYTFNSGDIVTYTINEKNTPVFISAREIDKNKLADKTYINTMFKYTHGYGVVINPLNKITSQGQVDFIMGGLVLNSIDKNLKITEPRIYYGELTRDRVIVNAANNLNEIDYDGKVETRYKGAGGIKLSLFNRLLFAAKYGDINMIISGYVSSDSKILINREVISRAQKAVPFLTVDKDPYVVLSDDGRLKWVLDAYTTTNYYPYSQSFGNFNYIRNAVKIVIDAYDGTVTNYIIDAEDPIINTYKKIYPGLFSDDPFPADIAKHIIYPELLFKIQTEAMKRYHLDPKENPENVSNFYYNQDLWDIAQYPENNTSAANGDNKRDIDAYYNLIKLPGISDKEEFILMRPFTPSNKNNMVSWMAVRNSFDNYGEMILYNFPKNTNIYGPYQVESNINTNDQISKDISLWSQSGSSVFKGSLLVIPIENSVLYVEPIYIQATGPSSIPQIKEIVVGYQKGEEFKYGIGSNLEEALGQLFQDAVANQEPVVPAPPSLPAQPADDGNEVNVSKDKLLKDIQQKYDDLKKQIDELGNLIKELG